MLSRGLSALLIAGSLSLAGGAQAFDRTCKVAQETQGENAARCMASMTAPETVVYGTLSDHGERYDAQGNPIDRQGNVIAVPAGRSGSNREVFVLDPVRR